ncbi:MAG: carboxypeptidase regulatory-like domain-containing protein [Bryobacteraceae bacterium]
MRFRPAAFLACAVALFAQSPTGNLAGRVQDVTGAVIPGATVKIHQAANRDLRELTTNDDGEFMAANLDPGNYRVTVEKEGFRKLDERGVTLQIDQTVRLEFVLQVGSVTETVEVQATVPLLNTDSATKGDVIVSREMLDIPLDGRDFADMAYLVPGVGQKAQGGNGSNFAVNGARTDNTNFIVDGFNNQNPRGGSAQARPPIDSMMEFKTQTTGYSAEYGRLAGGTINMVLKTGTNRLHGTVFEFLRNDVFDARNFFDPQRTKLRRNQFGAVLDGPVYLPRLYDGRNRTFFLFDWEGYRQVTGNSRIGRVPTLAERQGDFTQSLDVDGQPAKLADPMSGGPSGSCAAGKIGYCFPGNVIPASRFDPIMKQVMAYYPLPNRTGVNNYYAVSGDPDKWDSFLAKGDQRIRNSDNLSVRFLKRFNRNTDPYAGSATGTFGNDTRERQMLAGVSYTRLFSSTLINEARMGLSRTAHRETGKRMGHDYAADWGLVGSTKEPGLVGFPRFTVTDMMALGNAANVPIVYHVSNYQWSDTLTWVKSRHLMKFGFEIMRTQFFQPYYNNNRGTFAFNGFWTTVPIADFELGVLNSVSRTVGVNPNYLFFTSYGFFAQDDLRLGKSLTLNLGLRYELPKPPVEKYGRLTNLVPELGMLLIASDRTIPNLPELVADAGLTGKVALGSQYGYPDSLVFTAYKCLAPRVGFAWRPRGGVRSVVRGGYGIFYGNNLWNPVRNDLGNVYPFSISQTYNKNSGKPELLTMQSPYGTKGNLAGVLTPNGFQAYPTPQYLQSWNMTVEREIGKAMAVEIAYVGSKGTHLGRKYNVNMPFRRPEMRLSGGGFPRPIAGFNDIDYYSFGSNSVYNAGIVSLRKRFAGGFFYRLNYVFSKSIDDASQIADASDGGYGGAQDARNLALERGRSDWDRGHGVTSLFMYTLPWRRHWLFGDWQVSGTARLQTGPPLTVKSSNVQLDQGEANRPDRIAKGTLPNPGPEMWYDRAAFPLVPNGAYHFGTSGRNILDGPGLLDMNLSLMKRLRLRERYNAQLRCEAFNALNHANFNLPNQNVNAPAGGVISAARAPRLIQVALKIQF